MSADRRRRRWVFLAVLLLAIAHQDFWFWSSDQLLFGFLPIGLAYHALFSVIATGVWLAIVFLAWPEEPEDETT